MNKSEEILRKHLIKAIKENKLSFKDEEIVIYKAMVEFAKLHVTEALKQASECSDEITTKLCVKNILNAYNLNNIK